MPTIARTVCLLALCAAATAAMTHDVIPNADTLFYWGAHPHPSSLTVKVGDTVHFKTFQNFHDIGLVSTEDEYNNCDVTNFDAFVSTAGELQADKPGEVTVNNGMLDYTVVAQEALIGTHYFVCSVMAGAHCRAGQKIAITIEAADAGHTPETHEIRGEEVPFWTVGVQYSDMTIALGDSVRFVATTEGLHDLALLNMDECPNKDCCTAGEMEDSDYTMLHSPEDFKTEGTYIWTPDATGKYWLACTLSAGGHCMNGQSIKVTVTAVEADDADSAMSTVPAVFLATLAVFASLFAMY